MSDAVYIQLLRPQMAAHARAGGEAIQQLQGPRVAQNLIIDERQGANRSRDRLEALGCLRMVDVQKGRVTRPLRPLEHHASRHVTEDLEPGPRVIAKCADSQGDDEPPQKRHPPPQVLGVVPPVRVARGDEDDRTK